MIYTLNHHTAEIHAPFLNYAFRLQTDSICLQKNRFVLKSQKAFKESQVLFTFIGKDKVMNKEINLTSKTTGLCALKNSTFISKELLCWRKDLAFLNLRWYLLNFIRALRLCWFAVKNHKRILFVNDTQSIFQAQQIQLFKAALNFENSLFAKGLSKAKKFSRAKGLSKAKDCGNRGSSINFSFFPKKTWLIKPQRFLDKANVSLTESNPSSGSESTLGLTKNLTQSQVNQSNFVSTSPIKLQVFKQKAKVKTPIDLENFLIKKPSQSIGTQNLTRYAFKPFAKISNGESKIASSKISLFDKLSQGTLFQNPRGKLQQKKRLAMLDHVPEQTNRFQQKLDQSPLNRDPFLSEFEKAPTIFVDLVESLFGRFFKPKWDVAHISKKQAYAIYDTQVTGMDLITLRRSHSKQLQIGTNNSGEKQTYQPSKQIKKRNPIDNVKSFVTYQNTVKNTVSFTRSDTLLKQGVGERSQSLPAYEQQNYSRNLSYFLGHQSRQPILSFVSPQKLGGFFSNSKVAFKKVFNIVKPLLESQQQTFRKVSQKNPNDTIIRGINNGLSISNNGVSILYNVLPYLTVQRKLAYFSLGRKQKSDCWVNEVELNKSFSNQAVVNKPAFIAQRKTGYHSHYRQLLAVCQDAERQQLAKNPWLKQMDLVFFTHPENARTLVNQMKRLRLPTIGIVSGSHQPQSGRSFRPGAFMSSVDYPIVGNPNSIYFVRNLLKIFISVIQFARAMKKTK